MNDLTAPRSRITLVRGALPLALAAFLLAPAFAAFAQDAAAPAPTAAAPAQPDPAAVVATVGDDTITEADLSFAAEDLGQELANIPPADQRAFLVTVLIDMKVMAQAGRTAGLDQTDIFKQRLSYLEDRALRRAYFADVIATSVTEDAVRAAYDKYLTTFEPHEEVHARHILVATKEDAEAVKAELATGKPFEVLAMEKSLDPGGAQNGGDLGFFSHGMMVQPFEDAAFALTEPGQISDPIQTQFGWHIIKLEERRQAQPPSFEELAQQLQQQVLFETFDDKVGGLKKSLAINIPDAALAAAVAAQSQPAEAEATTDEAPAAEAAPAQ
jgi:peptidyl-prolyl cis-trans isomerase C